MSGAESAGRESEQVDNHQSNMDPVILRMDKGKDQKQKNAIESQTTSGKVESDFEITSDISAFLYNGEICQVCKEKTSKYRCPACNVRSCSLLCVTTHKKSTNCAGKRRRVTPTTYTPANQLTPDVLLDDQLLLDEAAAKIKLNDLQVTKRKMSDLQRKCRNRNIHLAMMPSSFQRAKLNKSRSIKGGLILWTIEWILLDDDLFDHPVNIKLPELQKFIKKTVYTQCTEDEKLKVSLEKLGDLPNSADLQILLKLEADRNHPSLEKSSMMIEPLPSRRLWPIYDHSLDWNTILSNRTIIEFPTIYIYHPKRV